MEKPNKKLKHVKNINYKKYFNSNLMNIEEYSKVLEIIPKEFEKNKEMHEFEEKIIEILDEIKSATNEYCDKLKQISKQLNSNKENNIGIIQSIISNTLKTSSKILEDAIKVFDENRDNPNISIYEDYISELESFNKDYSLKIDTMDSKRKNYIEEVVQYEAYLVNKELGLLESINNENNKKKKKDKDKMLLIDNHLKVFELQENYLAIKQDLINKLKDIILYINNDRKSLSKSLKKNTELFITSINMCLNELKKMITKCDEVYRSRPIIENEDLINEDKLINKIVKDDLHIFKFLSNKNIDENQENEEQKNKKKKKDKKDYLNIEPLLNKLEDENIQKLLKELENQNIKCNHENEPKINLLKNKKKVEKYINLIINEPEKYNDKYKKEINSLLEDNIENQTSCMQYLNNYRAKGSFELKKNTIMILCDLFTTMVDKAVKNNNYKIIQFALILSLTYYHIKEDEKTYENININNAINEEKKIYMTHYLKKSEPFHSKEFWLNYLQALIQDEIDKLIKRKEKNISDKQKSVAVFSSSFTLIKNMIDYDLDFCFINNVLEDVCKQNKFKDTEKQEIVNFLIAESQQKVDAK